MRKIHLSDLNTLGTIPTAALRMVYSEAASVCLDKNGHSAKVELKIEGQFLNEFELSWEEVSLDTKDSWRDFNEATEHGAIAIALLILHYCTPYKVVSRSSREGGIDFWLGTKKAKYPFEYEARLEVSGILKGKKGQINARMKEKLRQSEQSDYLRIPVFVIIVEFSKPLALTKKR